MNNRFLAALRRGQNFPFEISFKIWLSTVRSTVRVNVGFKTGVYRDFQGLFETQIVQNIGASNFNDTINGKTQFPVVADPDVAQINQLWLSWSGLLDTQFKAGRQGINIDNQRFVGTVNWRQNDQVFDSVVLTNASVKNLDLMYAYVTDIHRIFGGDSSVGNLDTSTHAAHASYKATDWLTATGYGYWIDIDRVPSLSSQTYGVRLTGETSVNGAWTFFYEAEAAKQSDHANNPASYDENYYLFSPGIKGHGFTFQAGYEELGGDGTAAFQTPLATLHAFNGWADKFLTTPSNGIQDAYGKVSYKVSGVGKWADNTVFDATYHDFNAENTSADYGTEWDLQASRTFKTEKTTYPFKEWSVAVKYADYDAEDLFTDTQKVWFTVGTKF